METLKHLETMAEGRTFAPAAPNWVPVGVTGHLTSSRGKRVVIRFDPVSLDYHAEGLTFATMADALAYVQTR